VAFVYAMNTKDYKFILKEWMNKELAEVLSFDAYKDYYTVDDVDMIIDQVFKIATDLIAPTNDCGEAHPAHFENGKVTVAPEFKPLYKQIQADGWGSSNIERNGEGVLPHTVYAAIQEMMASANPAWAPYVALTTGSSNLIQTWGTDDLKQMFLPKMWNGDWSGAMNLTEPGAGSDVGDILSRAYPTDDPRIYKIKGTKCFITGGDHDMTENIIHLTLARVEGAAPGTKGISLFVVPKIWVNEDGSLGEPNDVNCGGVEHKMGLKGSSTAILNMGESNNCRGWILGKTPGEDGKGDGMKQMFLMMNEARAETGHAALSVATNAMECAAQYARERIQGRLLTNPKAGRTAIINHEDVKRMLLDQKSQLDAARAMIFKTYYYLDVEKYSSDEEARHKADGYIQILTPLVKAHCSDIAWPLIGEAIQTYGGYGYIEEYPVAQAARDVKIFSIWEGTNFIQAMDLVGRKWLMDGGKPFQAWLDDIKNFTAEKKVDELGKEFEQLEKASVAYDEIRMAVGGYFAQKQYSMLPLHAHKIMTATAQLYMSMLSLDQALCAMAKLKEHGEDYFDAFYYKGKIANAKYYLNTVTPNIRMTAEIVKAADTSVIDVPTDFF